MYYQPHDYHQWNGIPMNSQQSPIGHHQWNWNKDWNQPAWNNNKWAYYQNPNHYDWNNNHSKSCWNGHWNHNWNHQGWNWRSYARPIQIRDYGPQPFVVNIEEVTTRNNTFRTALWTGSNLQLTVMSIDVGEDIGLEVHPNLDQFLRIEEGQGLVQMGENKNNLTFQEQVYDDYAIFIPAGTWHNVINTGNQPLKLYSIYAPPEHPYGTVHETKEIAMAAEEKE